MTWAARIPTLAGLRYPQASFVLDFASNYYRGSGAQGSSPSALPGYNFTRALAAYAEDTAGNLIQFASGVPRITNKGVLIEESRTNLLLRSQEFDNAAWIKSAATITANAAIAPDGTQTADAMLETAISAQHYVFQNVSKAASATTYTFSGYAKQFGQTRNLKLTLNDGGGNGVDFIVNTATLSTVSGPSYYAGTPFTSASVVVTAAANGWVRFAMTATTNAGTAISSTVQTAQGTTLSFLGDTSTGFYFWGAQLEAGSFATSYIPTTSASVTRPADVFYYSTSFYQSIQTVAAQAEKSPSAALPRIVGGALSAKTALYQANPINSIGTYNGTTTLNKISTLAAINYSAVCWDSSSRKVTFNGATPLSDANTMSDWGNTYIGSDNGDSQFYDAYIQRIAIYPFAASDAQLQSISSGNF